MDVSGLDHLVLYVEDIDATCEFYCIEWAVCNELPVPSPLTDDCILECESLGASGELLSTCGLFEGCTDCDLVNACAMAVGGGGEIDNGAGECGDSRLALACDHFCDVLSECDEMAGGPGCVTACIESDIEALATADQCGVETEFCSDCALARECVFIYFPPPM